MVPLALGVNNVIIRNLMIRDTMMPDDDLVNDAYDYDAIQPDTGRRHLDLRQPSERIGHGPLNSRKDATSLTGSWTQSSTRNRR